VSADRIERIDLFHVDVPLPTPFFPCWIPGYPQNNHRYTLLKITTRDGLVGHATGMALDREREGLGDFIGPLLIGLDPTDVHGAVERLRQAAVLGWRNAWISVAFWDIAAQARAMPLWQLLAETSGRPHRADAQSIEAYASFGEYRPAAVRAESIERARRFGFRAAKIGLRAVDVAEDLEQISVARGAAGEDFDLIVHAHQGTNFTLFQEVPTWDVQRARTVATHAAEHRVRWLQEPLHTEDLDGLAGLAAEAPLPIAGGDYAAGYTSARSLIEHGACSVFTPDVTFVGLHAVTRTFGTLIDRGLQLAPSCYGDGLSLTANFHALLAWSAMEGIDEVPRMELPWEPPAMMPSLRDALLQDPIEISADGTLAPPTGTGLGVPISDSALRRYGKRFYTLTPVRFAVTSARRSGLRQTAALARPKRDSSSRSAAG